MATRKKPAKKPKLYTPHDFNIGNRGQLYQVWARPLIPARAAGHPFRNKKLINITPLVESVSWSSSDEESGAITGNLTVRNPGNWLGILVAGSKVIIKEAKPFLTGVANPEFGNTSTKNFRPILEMMVQERDKQQTEMTMSVTLADRLTYLKNGEHDFNFAKKKGKKAPTASEIIRSVCKKERIPFNKHSIPKTRIGIDKISAEDSTILDFFVSVLKKHNELVDKRNGKKGPPPNWDISMRTGILVIRPRRPQGWAWVLNENQFLGEPSYRESSKELATKVTVTGKGTTYKSKKNKDGSTSKRRKAIRKKIEVSVQDDLMIATYGLIHHKEKVSGNLTPERAKRVAYSVLAKKSRMQRELSFSCPALPEIWPGIKVHLHLPSYGMKGLFTVKAVEYTITGAEGPMMNLTIDAGNVSVVTESAPRIVRVKRTRLRKNGRTVDIYWSDKHTIAYTHPKRFKVARVEIVHVEDLPESERARFGESVLIHYTNKKKVRIQNRVTYPQGLVSVTDEGYIPNPKTA